MSEPVDSSKHNTVPKLHPVTRITQLSSQSRKPTSDKTADSEAFDKCKQLRQSPVSDCEKFVCQNVDGLHERTSLDPSDVLCQKKVQGSQSSCALLQRV